MMAELGQPVAQYAMHALGADHGPLGIGQRTRKEDERERMAPAHLAMRADELLEGGDLLGVGRVSGVDEHVGAVREPVGPAHVGRRIRTEWRERILALDELLIEEVLATRAEDDRSALR